MERLGLVKHRIGDAYRSVVGSLTATSTESRFVENGTLTPEEFVQAGDQLTFKFPTWQWEAGEPSKRASYLPTDRQYLITRNVPCRDRVRALDYALKHQTKTEEEWLLPESAAGGSSTDQAPVQDVEELVDAGAGAAGAEAEEAGPVIVAQEDFLPDFADLDAQLKETDPAAAAAEAVPAFGQAADGQEGSDKYLVADAPDAHLVKTRTYDLSITYDKYYQTPRLWLFGYDERGEPLRPELVYEDVLSEYIAKTVTVDPHPLSGTPTVSIHPCKHAQVMKKVVQDWIDQGIEPRHDLALFVFLKFISGVVPTINYDFTMDIEF